MQQRGLFLISTLVALVLASMSAAATTANAVQTGLHLTIYQQPRAVVNDTRSTDCGNECRRLVFSGISSQIIPETAALAGATVVEQNFDYDLLTPDSLLRKHVGKGVTLVRDIADGEGRIELDATLLSYVDQQAVFEVSNGGEKWIETLPANRSPWRFVFSRVPDNLRAQPTLSMTLAEPPASKVRLSYVTKGLSWKADYVAVLDKEEKAMSLTGWVTLTNETGVNYPDARITLIAGELNLARQEKVVTMARMRAFEDDSQPQEQTFSDYKLYHLPRRTEVKNRQDKQVALLQTPKVEVQRRYQLNGSLGSAFSGKQKADVWLQFDNNKAAGLGMALPAGTLRFYKADDEGTRHLVGEAKLDATDTGETVDKKTGKAFGLTVEKVVKDSDYQRLNKERDITVQYRITNSQDKPVELLIIEQGQHDSDMLDGFLSKTAAGRYEGSVSIPANSTREVTYEVRLR